MEQVEENMVNLSFSLDVELSEVTVKKMYQKLNWKTKNGGN